MTSNNLTIEQKIDELIDAIINACESGSVGEITPAQFDEMMQSAKQQLISLIQEEKIKCMLKMVETANCILQADEPAIDEIWFDLDMPDDSIMPMRQDTMLSELKHRLQALKQPNGDK